MDTDRVERLLEEIRDLQRELVESHAEARRAQRDAIEDQRAAIVRQRKLQIGLGIVIAALFVVVVVVLWYVLGLEV